MCYFSHKCVLCNANHVGSQLEVGFSVTSSTRFNKIAIQSKKKQMASGQRSLRLIESPMIFVLLRYM